jgi:hypothetical protein
MRALPFNLDGLKYGRHIICQPRLTKIFSVSHELTRIYFELFTQKNSQIKQSVLDHKSTFSGMKRDLFVNTSTYTRRESDQ